MADISNLIFDSVAQAQRFLKLGEPPEDGAPVVVDRDNFGEGHYDAKKGMFVFGSTGYISKTQSRSVTATPTISLEPPPPAEARPPRGNPGTTGTPSRPATIVVPPKGVKPEVRETKVAITPPVEFTGDLDLLGQLRTALSADEFRGYLFGRVITVARRLADRAADRVPDIATLGKYVDALTTR